MAKGANGGGPAASRAQNGAEEARHLAGREGGAAGSHASPGPGGLTAVQLVAISQLLSREHVAESRARAAGGRHELDFLCRVRGELKIGDPYTQKVVARADPWLLLAVALSKLNKPSISRIVREAEKLANGSGAAKQIKEEASEAIKKIKEATERPCAGRVTSRLLVELLNHEAYVPTAVIGA